jgi:hypothetical protein
MTLACAIPGTAAIAFSTRPTQLAQVIPSTGMSIGRSAVSGMGAAPDFNARPRRGFPPWKGQGAWMANPSLGC